MFFYFLALSGRKAQNILSRFPQLFNFTSGFRGQLEGPLNGSQDQVIKFFTGISFDQMCDLEFPANSRRSLSHFIVH